VAEHVVRTTLFALANRVSVKVDIGGVSKHSPLGAQATPAAVEALADKLAALILADLEDQDEKRTEDRKHARKCIKALRAHLNAGDDDDADDRGSDDGDEE